MSTKRKEHGTWMQINKGKNIQEHHMNIIHKHRNAVSICVEEKKLEVNQRTLPKWNFIIKRNEDIQTQNGYNK